MRIKTLGILFLSFFMIIVLLSHDLLAEEMMDYMSLAESPNAEPDGREGFGVSLGNVEPIDETANASVISNEETNANTNDEAIEGNADWDNDNEDANSEKNEKEEILDGVIDVGAETYLNVRTGPWGDIIGNFHKNDEVEILSKEGDWFKIKFNGKTAFVHSYYVNAPGFPSHQGIEPPVGLGSSQEPGDVQADAASGEAIANAYKGGKLSPSEFAKTFGPAARESMQKTGVPASIILAQAALETGWGAATIGSAKNLFGIKGTGPAGTTSVSTQEFINGKMVTVQAGFRKYNSWSESIEDHSALLQNSRYKNAMANKDDPDQFAREIQKAGYATDPDYATKLISIMKDYNLYQYNQ